MPVTVGEVCEFITQTFIQTPGVPPLWLRLEPRCVFALEPLFARRARGQASDIRLDKVTVFCH